MKNNIHHFFRVRYIPNLALDNIVNFRWEFEVKYLDMKNEKVNKYIGIGIAIGSGVGTALGVVFDNIPMGISLGIPLGIAFGALLGKAKQGKDPEG